MAYISNADIQERLGAAAYVQLADDDGDGQADVGVVDEVRLGAWYNLLSFLYYFSPYLTPVGITEKDIADVLSPIGTKTGFFLTQIFLIGTFAYGELSNCRLLALLLVRRTIGVYLYANV